MKKSRFTEEQIAFALKQAELGTSVPEVCCKLDISDATFYTWRKKYGGISPSELKHIRQLEEENLRLKKLVADLRLDKAMLQEVLAKKNWRWRACANGSVTCRHITGPARSRSVCTTGQPQLFPLPLCCGRRQCTPLTNQGYNRNPDPLWLPQSSRHAQAGGWRDNHKRIYQLYREKALSLRLKRPRRNKSAQRRQPQPQGLYSNHVWAWVLSLTPYLTCVGYVC